MDKSILTKYTISLSLSFIILFLIGNVSPEIVNSLTIQKYVAFLIQILFIAIQAIFIISLFKKVSSAKYSTFIALGLKLSIYSAFIMAAFVYLYINFIDTYYFDKLASTALDHMNINNLDDAYEDFLVSNVQKIKDYHVIEISILLSIVVKAIALSLIIGAPFSSKNIPKDSTSL